MTIPLHTLITQYIRTHGALTVHDYMQLCLQHPEYGYYRKAQAVGAEGDFITAPEISQIFGDMLGMWLIHAWQVCGAPKAAALVELGPGRGTLSADILRMVGKNEEAAKVFALHLVESNETLREQQAQKLWKHQPVWHDVIDSLPTDRPLFVVANEFFDALPIRQFVGEMERGVALQNDALVFMPEGEVTRETCPAAIEIITQLAERLKKQNGCLLVVDYGYEGLRHQALCGGGEPSATPHVSDSMLRSGGKNMDTLQALKNHAYHPILSDMGEADLTAHVDFGALAEAAQEAGLHVHGMATQGRFLERLGGEIWLKKLQATHAADAATCKMLQDGWLRVSSPIHMGELFKVMAFTPQPCELAGLR